MHPFVALPAGAPVALLVGDREWPLQALAPSLVAAGYRVLLADAVEHACGIAGASHADVIFVDLHRPAERARALAALRALASAERIAPQTAIVGVASEALGRDELLAALAAGAWEVVAVPCDVVALLARCTLWCRAKRDADRLRQIAVLEVSTGLHTPHGLRRRVDELGATASRMGHALSCVAIGGRVVNAAALLSMLRMGDVAGRLGADEVAILAPGADGTAAHALAQRLARLLAERTGDARARGAGIRVGVCTVAPTEWRAGDGAALLAAASAAADADVRSDWIVPPDTRVASATI